MVASGRARCDDRANLGGCARRRLVIAGPGRQGGDSITVSQRDNALSRRAFLIGGVAAAVSGCGIQVDDDPATGPVTADVGPLPELAAALDPGALGGPVRWISFGAGGSLLAASDGLTVGVWRTAGLTSSTPPAYTRSVNVPIALSPHDDRLFMGVGGGGGSMELMVWTLDGAFPVQCATCLAPAAPGGSESGSGKVDCSALAMSPSGRFAAVADSNQRLWVWDVEAQRVAKILSNNAGYVSAMAFDSSESRIATACSDTRSSSIWDISTGARMALEVPPQSWANSVAFSPSGETILYAYEGLVILDATTGERLHGPLNTSAGANSAIYSPSGAEVVSADAYGNVAIRSDELSAPLHKWTAPLSLSSCAFSPELGLLAVGADQGVIYIWDCAAFL